MNLISNAIFRGLINLFAAIKFPFGINTNNVVCGIVEDAMWKGGGSLFVFAFHKCGRCAFESYNTAVQRTDIYKLN